MVLGHSPHGGGEAISNCGRGVPSRPIVNSIPGPDCTARGTEITGMDVGEGGAILSGGRAVETNPITPPATTTTASAGTNLVIVAMLLRLTRIHLEAGQEPSQQVVEAVSFRSREQAEEPILIGHMGCHSGLFEWNMLPRSGGAEAHVHKTFSDHFPDRALTRRAANSRAGPARIPRCT